MSRHMTLQQLIDSLMRVKQLSTRKTIFVGELEIKELDGNTILEHEPAEGMPIWFYVGRKFCKRSVFPKDSELNQGIATHILARVDDWKLAMISLDRGELYKPPVTVPSSMFSTDEKHLIEDLVSLKVLDYDSESLE